MRRIGRSFLRRDDAVTEVIGYVLSFALSAIFLLIALNVFSTARGNTEHVVTGVELRTLADRVASRIVEMGLVSQEFPNATMQVSLVIPQSLNGKLYTITATAASVRAETNDGSVSAAATTYRTEALPGIVVSGAVDSSNERLKLLYQPDGAARRIQILEE
ncbi:MAG TPA: hypothetical protein VM582_10165 [Candidatus Thermoplasmatota archaeon]|nr:hypothetical protein [Candidatus Thermoplasmatota archaeon]